MEEEKGKKDREEAQSAAASVWDCGSPLYDSYEIASLGHILERNMLALPHAPCRSKRYAAAILNPRHEKGLAAESRRKLEGVHEEGFLPRLMGTYLWKKTAANKNDDKGRRSVRNGGFYGLCFRFGFSRK